ncbi:MAG: hypothetical protein ACE5J9_00540 [Methanosarcinales archaeon]
MDWKWKSNTHISMTEVALQYMSPLFQEIVNGNKGYFELGVIAPDRLFKDTINHYYNISNGVGKVHKKVSSEVQLVSYPCLKAGASSP